jgi:hypothetical protein
MENSKVESGKPKILASLGENIKTNFNNLSKLHEIFLILYIYAFAISSIVVMPSYYLCTGVNIAKNITISDEKLGEYCYFFFLY